MSAWWEDYHDDAPMVFPRHDFGPTRRVSLTTEPKLERTRGGALRLKLVNRHPHEAVRIFSRRSWTK